MKNWMVLYCSLLSMCMPSYISVQKAQEGEDGQYIVRETIKNIVSNQPEYMLQEGQKIYIDDYSDSLITYTSKEKTTFSVTIELKPGTKLRLKRNGLEVDLFVVLFKIRPSRKGFLE